MHRRSFSFINSFFVHERWSAECISWPMRSKCSWALDQSEHRNGQVIEGMNVQVQPRCTLEGTERGGQMSTHGWISKHHCLFISWLVMKCDVDNDSFAPISCEFFNCTSPFSVTNWRKKRAQPTWSFIRLTKIAWKVALVGRKSLFGAENREEKLKKNTEDFFCKNDTFTRHGCTKN